MRRITGYCAAGGALAALAVHTAVLLGAALPAFAFVLHATSLALFGVSFLLLFDSLRAIPPEHRFQAVWYFLKQRPVLSAIPALASFYAASCLVLSPPAGFSALWIAFHMAALRLSLPLKPAPVSPAPAEPAREFMVSHAGLVSRTLDGSAKYAYAWILFLTAGFATLGFMAAGFFVVSGFFAVILAVNLALRLYQVRVLIVRAAAADGNAEIDYLLYEKPCRITANLSSVRIEFTEQFIRGNSIFRLTLRDEQGRELISQSTSSLWHYAKLKELYDRLILESQAASQARSAGFPGSR